jgi:hypothetical protein
MGKKIRVWDGSAWQDVAPSLPYTAIHSAQASMPATGVDGQVWLDTDGALAGQDFVPLTGGTMTGNLNTPSINSGGISGKNYVVNSNFDFWQRGTSFTTDSAATWIYTADRWAAQNLYSGGGAVNVVTQETTHVPAGSKYSIKSVVGTASVVNNGRMNLLYTLENQDAISLTGKVITISAQVKAIGAVDRYNIAGYYSTSGGKAHAATAYISGNASVINSSGFTKVSATFTVPSASTLTSTGTLGILFVFYKNNGVPESVGDGVYLSQVKIEEGSTATTFSTAEPTMAGELSACQRYFARYGSSAAYSPFGTGFCITNAALSFTLPYRVRMRINPTLSFSAGNTFATYSAGGAVTAGTSMVLDRTGDDAALLTLNVASGLAAGQAANAITNAGATAFIDVSAEL